MNPWGDTREMNLLGRYKGNEPWGDTREMNLGEIQGK